MGYSHYWEKPDEIAPDVFRALVADFRKLIPLLEEHGVSLRDGWGENEPLLLDNVVCFNGLADCGCGRQWLEKPAAEGGCAGGCGYDSFFFPRLEDPEYPSRFCKTNRHRYDLAVTAFLVVARHHLGEAISVSSDSHEPGWDFPRRICQQVLGYGDKLRVVDALENAMASV